MANLLEEVKKDIAELQVFQSQATSQRVKDILTIEIRKLVTETTKLQKTATDTSISEESTKAIKPNKCYQVKINNYAWDQSSNFLKLYVTLQKVHEIPSIDIQCNWTNKSVELNVKSLDNKDFFFIVKNLLHEIDPSRSFWKIKTDMVIISLAKKIDQNWSHVTELEKKANESKKLVPDVPDTAADPGESLMKMFKQMYESGDDEMKRTIAKAWTEGQNKRKEL